MMENRIDFMDVNPWAESEKMKANIEKPFKKTVEGYLEGRAIVSNVGVFTYLLPDGSFQRELRLPEEVFAEQSVNSLKLKPVTNEHPTEKVTTENIKKYQIGHTGDQVFTDEFYLSIPISITDAEAIVDVQNGKQAFSCGYTVELDFTPGTWLGVDYDAIQRNIVYNHVALVDRGRAGDRAKMKMDEANKTGIQIKTDSVDNIAVKNNNDGGRKMDQIIKIDGVDYTVDKDVKKHIHSIETKFDTLKKETDTELEKLRKQNSELQAKSDQYEDEKLELKKQIEDAKQIEKTVLDNAVKDRMLVLSASEVAEVELKGDEDDLTIKKMIIKKLYPSSTEKIDSADATYIEARFDVALEKIADIKKDSEKVSAILKSDVKKDSDTQERTVEQARNDMRDHYLNLYKTKEVK